MESDQSHYPMPLGALAFNPLVDKHALIDRGTLENASDVINLVADKVISLTIPTKP